MANNESTDVIREKVDSFEYKPQISSFGHVLKVGDGIFWADGLEGLQLSELVELPGEIYGMALSLAENYNGIALLNGEYEVTEGMEAPAMSFKCPYRGWRAVLSIRSAGRLMHRARYKA